MAWDPTAKPESVWREIELSRDENGTAQARIELAKWNAGKRLAYENRVINEAVKVSYDDAGGKIRKVMPGAMRSLHVQLTVIGSEGFGPGADFTSAQWLNTLSFEVFEEVHALAIEVQPIPSLGAKRPTDHKAAGSDAPGAESGPPLDEDDEQGDGDAPDPSRRPSTPAE
jgi:hypothetical protein